MGGGSLSINLLAGYLEIEATTQPEERRTVPRDPLFCGVLSATVIRTWRPAVRMITPEVLPSDRLVKAEFRSPTQIVDIVRFAQQLPQPGGSDPSIDALTLATKVTSSITHEHTE